jgi:hypothetical protein
MKADPKSSKERLSRIIEKKLQTSFIGAISQFETFFGSLWSGNTAEQRKLKELWEQCRTKVLNNGNNQIRALMLELSQYNVEWNMYHMELKGPYYVGSKK